MKALIVGSFNPIHLGHMDIIRRTSRLFDEVIVVVADNPHKSYSVPAPERMKIVNQAIKSSCIFPMNITVKLLPWNMSIAEFAIENKADEIIKGIRNSQDVYYENAMAQFNRHARVETMYLPCNPVYTNYSSSLVREMIKYNMSIENYVVLGTEDMIREKYEDIYS